MNIKGTIQSASRGAHGLNRAGTRHAHCVLLDGLVNNDDLVDVVDAVGNGG